jgi:hypothetical protein
VRRKNQGLEDSENDMWIWMRPHIRFCTIEKCDLDFHFLLRRYLPLFLNFSSSFFLFHEAFYALVLVDEISPLLLLILAPFLSFFFKDPSFVGERLFLLESS